MKILIGLFRLTGLSLILVLFFAAFGSSATFYVDQSHPSANDTNPGTEDLPWLTIQHAAETLVAGDTVLIKDGLYNEHVNVLNSGAASNHIVYSAYPGDTPVLDGTGVVESQNGIIVDQSYIKLLGLEIQNWENNGIWIESASFVEISDCEVHDVVYGIGTAYGTHDFEFNRVEVHHFDLYGFDASPGGGADCYNGTFNDCISHTGRDPGQNVDGFALGHGSQHDFTFNRCITYEVYDGFDVGENDPGSQDNVILSRCRAYGCTNDGFKLTGQATMVNCLSYNSENANAGIYWGYNPGTSVLQNCTFMDCGTYNVWTESSNDSIRMFNCIIAGGDNIGLGFELRDAGVYTGDYNLFHNDNPDRAVSVGYEDDFSLSQIESGEWTTYSGQDANSLVAYTDTEIFVNPATYDLYLLANSPAVDNGTSVGAPSEDFAGNPRPHGSGYDIGAYEFSGVGIGDEPSGGIPRAFALSQNFPNPFNPMTTIEVSIPQGNPRAAILTILDIRGRRVRTLHDGELRPGRYTFVWDGRNDDGLRVASGIYLYMLNYEDHAVTRKMTLLK